MKSNEMKEVLKKYYGNEYEKRYKEAKKEYGNERGALNSIAHERQVDNITGVVMGLYTRKNRNGSVKTYLQMIKDGEEIRLLVPDDFMEKLEEVEVFQTVDVKDVDVYVDILKDKKYYTIGEETTMTEAKKKQTAIIKTISFGKAFEIVYNDPTSDIANDLLRNTYFYSGEVVRVNVGDWDGDKSVTITLEDESGARQNVKIFKQPAGAVEPDLDYMTEMIGTTVEVTKENREFISNMLLGMPVLVRGKIGLTDNGNKWLSGSPAFGGFVVCLENVDVDVEESDMLDEYGDDVSFKTVFNLLKEYDNERSTELVVDELVREFSMSVENAEKVIEEMLMKGMAYDDAGTLKVVE